MTVVSDTIGRLSDDEQAGILGLNAVAFYHLEAKQE
jgi:hypothetical protein